MVFGSDVPHASSRYYSSTFCLYLSSTVKKFKCRSSEETTLIDIDLTLTVGSLSMLINHPLYLPQIQLLPNMCSVASSLKFDVGEDGTKSDSNSNSARSRSVVEASGVKANSAHDATDATLNVNDKEECNKSDTECSTPVSDSYTNEDHSIRYQHHKKLSPFPLQLMDLIENESVDENAATINGYKALEWLPTGDKFIIRDRRTVERCVLPKYFSNNCKFMSFVRKLYR